ncbi:MAG: rRNA maturation RNase YbeY [Spirochaetales bacterium]|nr:rRNA maturation RNase YbeY [Spirochaetales bacterium]
MNVIEISYTNLPELKLDIPLQKFCVSVLERLNINNWEISILFCDDVTIKDLNHRYRKKNEPTDILSFCQDLESVDNIIYAGDIIISWETIKYHADIFNVALDEELKRVVIHGILHLNAMDHQTNLKDEQMLLLQEELLKDVSGERIV